MLFGRNPVVLLGLVSGAIQLLSALALHLSVDQQGVLNSAVAVAVGALMAWQVSAEKGIALLSGVVKALMAVALAFGAHLDGATQSSIMVFVTAGVAFWLRGQVEAQVPTDMAPAAR